MGLSEERQFQNYHRVLNRARWSSLAVGRILLLLLVAVFVPGGAPIVIGLDDTIERRWGAKIAARGIYRDPVRSSKGHFVKASGLRWISVQLLAWVPWADRVWGLPFLTVLAPSERYAQARKRRHKTLSDWARQIIKQLRRWLPGRALVVVADSTYAVIELLAACAGLAAPVTVVTRLRLDAALYDPAPVRQPGTRGAPRKKGDRQPNLAQRLVDPLTAWAPVSVRWYGGETRLVEVRLDDVQRDGADSRGEYAEGRVPQDRIVWEADVDELPGEQPSSITPAPLTSIVAAHTSTISRSRRVRARPRRKVDSDALQRCSRTGTKLCSANRAATNSPSSAIAAPATTIAVARPAAQPSTPNATIPVAPPRRSQRAPAVKTWAMRSGRSSSSVTQATSAPVKNAHPRPHNTCVTTIDVKSVTRPVSTIPAARNPCPIVSDRLRLNASDHTPVGTSDSTIVTATTMPRRTTGRQKGRR